MLPAPRSQAGGESFYCSHTLKLTGRPAGSESDRIKTAYMSLTLGRDRRRRRRAASPSFPEFTHLPLLFLKTPISGHEFKLYRTQKEKEITLKFRVCQIGMNITIYLRNHDTHK